MVAVDRKVCCILLTRTPFRAFVPHSKRLHVRTVVSLNLNHGQDTRANRTRIEYRFAGLWAFLLTVKRDTQKERATKSRNSWGAVEAVRVRATGSPRAHRYFAVGHGRRSPSIPKSVDRRPPWQVAHHQRAAIAGCRQAQAGGVPRIARGLEGNKDKHILGFLVNSETRPRGSDQPNLGTLGFLVNSETRHRGSEQPNFGVVFIQ